MNFLGELQRRNVTRVAILYIVVSWLLLQVGELFFEMLALPDWSLKLLFGLLALGFPLALIFSWVFELTPEGIKREKDIDHSQSIAPHTGRRIDRLIIVILGLLVVVLVADRFLRPPAATESPPQALADGSQQLSAAADALRSIAVLPFADMSAEGNQAYFADGISEELLNLLARLEGLKVAARTSSFKFRGGDLDVGEIGRALNVSTVLEGSVRKAGNQVRITAQLIKVDDGFHLWSESYDRTLDNLFAVQDEIAEAIVDALKLELELDDHSASRTQNVQALELYLRGRELAREPSKEGLLKAVDYYRAALDLDPRFAQAWSGLAQAWVWLEDYGGMRSAEAYPKAEDAAKRALELDPDLAEAHAAMAFVQDRYHSNAIEAQRYFERTIELNPNLVMAYNWYSDTLEDLGELGRMVEVLRTAAELDPLSTFYQARLGGRLFDAGLSEEAGVLLDELLTEHPNDTYAHEVRGDLYGSRMELSAAVDDYLFVHHNRPGDPYAASWIASYTAAMGDRALADEWLAAARARGADNRWELDAREVMAWIDGDWQAMETLGALRGAWTGSVWRGWSLILRDRLDEARQSFETALALLNYRKGNTMVSVYVEPLTGLLWLDQAQGESVDSETLERVQAHVLKLDEQGAFSANRIAVPYHLARLSMIAGDADQAVKWLDKAVETSFYQIGLLERDPTLDPLRDSGQLAPIVDRLRERLAAEYAKLDRETRVP